MDAAQEIRTPAEHQVAVAAFLEQAVRARQIGLFQATARDEVRADARVGGGDAADNSGCASVWFGDQIPGGASGDFGLVGADF